MSVPAPQSVLPEQTVLNIQENSGQVAIGQYVVQIGSVHGGVVNISMPEQPALRPLAVADPALLPPPPDLILDRVAETEAASRILQAGQIIEFTGEGGIGKTTLLEHLAHHAVAQSFPAGTVYLSARRKLVEDLLQELFDAFHDPDPNHPITVKPTHIQLQRTLRDKKFLIILDDVHLDRDELKELKRLAPGCSLLLAAPERHLWRRNEGQTLNLPGLPVENAIDLLEYELGRPFTTEEYNTAKALCLALDGHPDHLIQAAALVREDGRRLPDLARQIQQQGPKALSGQAIAALPDPQQQVIQALAALGGAPLSVEHLNAITGLEDTGPLIEALLRRGIVQAHSPRYSLVGNLGQLVQQEADLIPWAERALGHFANWAELRQADPGRLLTDLEPLLQSLSWGMRNGYWPRVLRLVRALEGALALSKYWGAWNRVLQAGLQAAQALGNETAEGWALHQLGTHALCVGETRLARDFLTQALQIREALGDTAGAAITRHNLELLLPPPPPTDSQPPGDSGFPSGGATSFAPLPLLAGAAAILLPLLLLAWLGWGYLFPAPSPQPSPSPQSGVRFLPVTATFTATPTPGDTPAAIVALPTDTPIPTIPPTFTALPPSPTPLTPLLLTATPTPLPPTATPTATATPTTPLPVTPGPEISSLDPISTEVGRQVVIRVAGNHFQSNEGGFRVELLGLDSRIVLGLDDLRTLTAFEAVVPANLPAGLYDLQITNPDNRVAFRAAAFEVFDRRLPVVQLLPDRLDFGEQQLNTQSENQTVTLVNAGLADLTLNSINLAGAQPREFNLTHTCPTVLLPNTACSLVVSFRPTATGSHNATISITDNATGSPHTVFLSGVGILRQPDLVITELEAIGEPLHNQESNQIDLPIRLVVRNQGDSSANIFKVTTDYTGGSLAATRARDVPFRAQASDQVDPQDGIAPSTRLLLPAGVEVTFTGIVSFEPEEQGQSLSLSALADSCNGDTGLPAFCRVEEENENNNRASLTVRLPRFDPQIFEVAPPSAEEGQSLTLTVTGENFRPTEEGFRVTLRQDDFETDLALGELRTATAFEAQVPPTLAVGQYELQVVNPDERSATEPDAFEVLPRAEPLIQLDPEQLTFPSQEVNSTGEPQQVTLTNVGTAALIFELISLSGDPDFQVSEDCLPNLAPNEACTLTVRFAPLKPGERQATLEIVSNATGSPHTVPLSGTGILTQPDLIIERFGALGEPAIDPKAGRFDLPVEVVVKNEGDAPADPFELSLERFSEVGERGNIGPAQNGDLVPFLLSPSDTIEPRGNGRVVSRLPLPAGQSLSFRGVARFELLEEEQSLLLLAVADTCAAGDGLPAFCRVDEQDETNNLSTPLRAVIPAAPRPRLTLEPGFLIFDEQEVGTRSQAQNVRLTNSGTAGLTFNRLSLAGAHPADFVLSHTCPLSLAPAGACTLSLTFVPTAAGPRNGLVNIIDNAEDSPHTVSLAGIGVLIPHPEIIRVDPALGEVKQVIPVTIEGENFDPRQGFQAELFNTQVSAELALGQVRTEERFEAVVPATLPAGLYDLRVTNPDGRSALKTGAFTLVEPSLPLAQLLPARLLFSGQKVNTASSTERITLTNVGSADLLINTIALAGANAADFILDPGCPATLPPDNSCLLSVSFRPVAAGDRTAEIRLASNALDTPHTVSLNGRGLAGQPDLIITGLDTAGPATVDRSTQRIKVPIQFGVQNTGDAPASIFKLSAHYTGGNLDSSRSFVVPLQVQTSADTDGSNSFYPFTTRDLPAGAQIRIAGTLTFNAIEQNALVSLTTLADSCSGDEQFPAYCRVEESDEANNPSGNLLIPLPGPRIQLKPAQIDFGFWYSGTTSQPSFVTLSNTGSATLNFSNFSLAGAHSGSFGLRHNCPASLAPGGNCQLTVNFSPSQSGSHQANITVASNAQGSPHTVTLTGFAR